MNHEKLAKLIVEEAIKRGVDDVAVLNSLEKSRMVRFSNNEITVVKSWKNLVTNLMIGKKSRVAVSSFSEISFDKIKNNIQDLVKIAESSKPKQDYVSLPTGPFKYKSRQIDENLSSISVSELINYSQRAIESALDEGAKRVAGTLIFNHDDIALGTSSESFGRDRTQSLEIFVRSFITKDASGQGISCSTNKKDFNPDFAGLESAKIAKMAKNPKTISSGRYDVIFGPSIFANLMNNVMDAASAFNVDAGLSFLNDEIGSEVASSQLTIIDDGTISDGPNSRAFDDEGIPTERTEIIEDGKLKSLLHNSTTAKKFNTSSTGNAGWIAPSDWNIMIKEGSCGEDEIFEKLGNGLYITNNWYTRFQDYRNGDFSTVPRDGIFEIKNGKIASSVKNIRISDNMLRIIRNIKEISNKRYWVRWWEVSTPTFTPYALVEKVGITKSVF